ncbi:hypothetical protein AB0C34_05235 [Nocardia sp. NPDC049220]|uniref:hypothetical protein n=1 Tax=Nocardia sp. NPDC049220 TaxID=3155273 RepID=UPI0033C39BA5
MLKSYKQLSRWYGALEPDKGAPESVHPDAASSGKEDDEPARGRRYLREDDEPRRSPSDDIPADLPAQRSEFIGGWSDWVAGRAPGPDDHYVVPRQVGFAQFPWADDEHGQVDRARPPASRAPRRAVRERAPARRARAVVVLIVAVVLFGAAGLCVLFLMHSSGNRAAAPKDSLVPASVQFTVGSARAGVGARPVAGGACPTERGDAIVRSAEAGGTGSGPDAVLSFQYAYYVERSGARAREVVAPDAAVQPAWVIQRGIDTVPAGTAHCVRIVEIGDNRYSVEVTEYRSGGVPSTYNKQTVTTAVIGGRTLITGIVAG